MGERKPSEGRVEGPDRSAFQIGDKPGEGGQADIQKEVRDHDELQEEFTGMAATGEQDFAKDGHGATREQH